MLGTHWTWAGIKTLSFEAAGKLTTPWGKGTWGVARKVKGMPQCDAPAECLMVDFSSALHHATFELPDTFTSVRVGDGEVVKGVRIDA